MDVTLDGQFGLHGKEISMEQAEFLKTKGCELLDQAPAGATVTADFGGLLDANSVTVALMVAWHRHAVHQQKSIRFSNLSAGLSHIIEFSGLNSVLNPQS